MANIVVEKKDVSDGWEFKVEVEEDNASTWYSVSMSKQFYESLDTTSSVETVVIKSFEFLLERESKESILGKFNIKVIGKYFPEYIDEIRKKL